MDNIWVVLVPFVVVIAGLVAWLARRGSTMGGTAEYDARLMRGEAIGDHAVPGHGGGGPAESRRYEQRRRP